MWPIKSGEGANQTSGMISAVKGGKGTIGYADLSQVGDLSAAKIKVGDEWIEPSAEGAAKAVEASPLEEGRPANDMAVKIDRTTTAAGAYPLMLTSYLIACPTYDERQGRPGQGLPHLRRQRRGPAGRGRQRRLGAAPGVLRREGPEDRRLDLREVSPEHITP